MSLVRIEIDDHDDYYCQTIRLQFIKIKINYQNLSMHKQEKLVDN